MKKFFFAVAMMTAMVFNSANAEIKRDGNVYVQVSSSRGSKAQETEFRYKAKDGKEYTIFVTEKGRCYINKISAKTGKEYKSYLNEEISRDICKQLGIAYVEPTKKN